ncbi:zinc knuckle protein [Aphelenchoides avenae]|nr:zinc knuckle protein [Aphelenchus avenae]
MVDSDVHSEHSAESGAEDGYTVEQLKDDADAEATAFNTSMELKLERLAELISQAFSVDTQPGNPDLDELKRLSDVREELLHNRDTTLRLRDVLQRQVHDFDAYHNSLPASKPYIRGPISKRFNQYMAAYQLKARREEALAHADEMGQLLAACDANIVTLEAQVRLARVSAVDPPVADAAPAIDDADGVSGADAAPTLEAEGAHTERRRKTDEPVRATTSASSVKKKDQPGRTTRDADRDFGDPTLPHGPDATSRGRSGGNPLTPDDKSSPLSSTGAGGNPSASALDSGGSDSFRRARGNPLPSRDRDTESIFGPLRSDIASSSSSTRATSTPLGFTAVGDSLLPTKDTGPDFSLYGSNPFYLNSVVKLPIPVDITYDAATKQPLISQTQLQPLAPPTFNGNFIYWPMFRDDFIRLVHAPGGCLSDAERLRYLTQALNGDALAMIAGYSASHGGGQYHHVTRALEEEYFRPFQACKVLHHDFLQMKPRNGSPEALRQFADLTIQAVNLLRDYDDDINRDRFAIENWMEKIPNQTRLEMCRTLEPAPTLTLEDAVRTLKRVLYSQNNAAIFSPTCGLGHPGQLRSSGNPLAIAAKPSGPIITEVKDDERTGGYFGNPKTYTDKWMPTLAASVDGAATTGRHRAQSTTVPRSACSEPSSSSSARCAFGRRIALANRPADRSMNCVGSAAQTTITKRSAQSTDPGTRRGRRRSRRRNADTIDRPNPNGLVQALRMERAQERDD